MTERMTEIQDSAQPAFLLVGGYDFGLDTHGIGDDSFQHGAVAREDAILLRSQNLEELSVGDNAALNDLEQPGTILAIWQAGQYERIDEHRQRLMKTADQIFPAAEIH